jgi:transposase
MRKVVGLDISLQKTAVCVLDRDGQVVWQGKVDSEPGPLIEKLRRWHDEIDGVGLEACPLSEWLHRHLMTAGFKAVCVETRHAQRFLSTRPVKTDKNDARGIAEMMRIGHYRPVHVKSAEAQLIRTTLQARRQIVATLLQIQGAIRGLLRMHGLKVGDIHRNRFDKRVRELLEEMPLPGPGRPEGQGLLTADDHSRRRSNHQPRFQGNGGRSDPIRFIHGSAICSMRLLRR